MPMTDSKNVVRFSTFFCVFYYCAWNSCRPPVTTKSNIALKFSSDLRCLAFLVIPPLQQPDNSDVGYNRDFHNKVNPQSSQAVQCCAVIQFIIIKPATWQGPLRSKTARWVVGSVPEYSSSKSASESSQFRTAENWSTGLRRKLSQMAGRAFALSVAPWAM